MYKLTPHILQECIENCDRDCYPVDKLVKVRQSVMDEREVSRIFILGLFVFHVRNRITNFYYIDLYRPMCKELSFLKLGKL